MERLTGEAWLQSRYKRLTDISIVAVFGPPSAIAAGSAAVAIACEMRRKPWFIQPRVGQDPDELLNILKLVTLRGPIEHEPSLSGHNHRQASKVGRFVRKFHIDEGLQLSMVAMGSMTAVGGYRPIVPIEHTQVMDVLSSNEQVEYLNALRISKPAIVTPGSHLQHQSSSIDPFTRATNAIEYANTASLEKDFGMLILAASSLAKDAWNR